MGNGQKRQNYRESQYRRTVLISCGFRMNRWRLYGKGFELEGAYFITNVEKNMRDALVEENQVGLPEWDLKVFVNRIAEQAWTGFEIQVKE